MIEKLPPALRTGRDEGRTDMEPIVRAEIEVYPTKLTPEMLANVPVRPIKGESVTARAGTLCVAVATGAAEHP